MANMKPQLRLTEKELRTLLDSYSKSKTSKITKAEAQVLKDWAEEARTRVYMLDAVLDGAADIVLRGGDDVCIKIK